ncbi:sensor histidine kinase [Actinomadura opuntiae]|uniref:sensor histidine kinase n=1 Tax=Actinomadura sp. OS1-43 TaxID=604315 RepID=UPI00255B3B33|nr:histidine kinase [Actinomadura sp. OS1-43]MDL4817053.1 histidine kinase [Actinomadura sp. OS1-43]
MERVVVVISAPRRRRSPPWFGAETRRALAAGPAVAALALAAGWPYWRDHAAAAAVSLVGTAGLAVVGVLLATGARTRRTGLLFVAASLCWALNWLASWDAGPGPLLSPYAQADFYLALAVGVLLYPAGRLEYLADRIWTVFACAVLWGCPTALWVTSRPEWAAFRGRHVWWPAPFPDHAAFRVVLEVSAVLYLVLAFSFAVVLLLRLPRMSPMRRAVTLPVTVALAFVGISAALTQRPIMEESISLDALLEVYAIQGAVVALVPLALLATGLRTRLAELAVAGRMLRLTAPPSVERVRDALRDVLHDPTLQLWFWAPAEEVYVDTAGRPVAVDDGGPAGPDLDVPPEEGTGRWRRRVETAAGEPLAIVELAGALRDHGSLVEAALEAGGRALETARLQSNVQAGLEQVRSAYGRLLRAEIVERERLARDLHDGAQQRLLALAAMLGTLEALAEDPAVKEHARDCRRELMAALAELRALAREVQPALLIQDGLGPALEVVAERLGTRVLLEVTGERYSREIESTLYSVLCEALSYAVDRARATRVTVRVRPDGHRLVAEVSDDGERPGVEPAAVPDGLAGRIRALRGHVEVDGDPSRGTTVRMVLPCE